MVSDVLMTSEKLFTTPETNPLYERPLNRPSPVLKRVARLKRSTKRSELCDVFEDENIKI